MSDVVVRDVRVPLSSMFVLVFKLALVAVPAVAAAVMVAFYVAGLLGGTVSQ